MNVTANRESDSLANKRDRNHACSLTKDFGIDSNWQRRCDHGQSDCRRKGETRNSSSSTCSDSSRGVNEISRRHADRDDRNASGRTIGHRPIRAIEGQTAPRFQHRIRGTNRRSNALCNGCLTSPKPEVDRVTDGFNSVLQIHHSSSTHAVLVMSSSRFDGLALCSSRLVQRCPPSFDRWADLPTQIAL